MKKILEVLQNGEGDIRFNTDFDVTKDADKLLSVAPNAAMAMMTTLWGGNEISVIAMIRALAIADLAVSVNTEEMLTQMKESALFLKKTFEEARTQFEKQGGRIETFAPGIKPQGTKS